MDFFVLTLFPDMVSDCLSHSITGRAAEAGLISVNAVNIRDFAENRHNRVDDYPYGGGAGMVMQPGPVYRAYQSARERMGRASRVVYMTPQGRTLNQSLVEELSQVDGLIILCGHYEGVDERALEEIVTDEISIGDYVLTGGELGAAVLIDAVSRFVPGVLGSSDSCKNESFSDGLLEYPQYTRPPEFMGRAVPEILLSGHHGNIEKWRRRKAIERTVEKRPDLVSSAKLSSEEKQYIANCLIDR